MSSFKTVVEGKGNPPEGFEYHWTLFPIAIKSAIVALLASSTQTPWKFWPMGKE